MASEDVLAWLNRSDWPRDFYELLGRWRFDPDVEAMKADVSQAMRELYHYQNHTSVKAQRAMRLQNEYVGRAEWLLSDPQKLQDENAHILQSLRRDFVALAGDDVSRWDEDSLLTWLVGDARVDPRVADEIRVCMLKNISWKPKPAVRTKTCPNCAATVPEDDPRCGHCAFDFNGRRVSVFGPRAHQGVDTSDTFFIAPSEEEHAPAPRKRPGPPPLFPREPAVSTPVRREPSREELTILPEQDGIGAAKLAAVIGVVVCVPLVLLIAVVVWMTRGDNDTKTTPDDEQQVVDDSNKTQNPDAKTTGAGSSGQKTKTVPTPPNGKTGKTTPAGGGKTAVAAKTGKQPYIPPPRSKIDPPSYVYWKNKGLNSKGKDERDAFLNAAVLAPDDDELALCYSYLAYNDEFLETATFEQLKAGIEALSRSGQHFTRIERLAARLATLKDFLSVVDVYLQRLKNAPQDAAGGRALKMLLASASKITKFKIPPATVFDSYAAMIRAQTRESDRLSMADDLVNYADKHKVTTQLLTHFQAVLKRDATDSAANAVLLRFVVKDFDKARALTGAARTTAIDAVINRAPSDYLKNVVLERLTYDNDYQKSCSFERGLQIFEVGAAKYLPPNRRLPYSLSLLFRRLATFVDDRGKLADAKKHYNDRLLKKPSDTLAREMSKGLAIGRAANYAAKISLWTATEYANVDKQIADFDAPRRAAAKSGLLATNYSYRNSLTPEKYLALREEIIGAVDDADRPAEIQELLQDIKYGMPTPPAGAGQSSVLKNRRFDAAVKYFRDKTQGTSVVSVTNLRILYELLKDRTSSRFNYDIKDATTRMAADTSLKDSVAKKLKLITGKSP